MLRYLKKILFLIRAKTRWSIIGQYCIEPYRMALFKKYNGKRIHHVVQNYKDIITGCDFTQDWFSPQLLSLVRTLDVFCEKDVPITILEIGSFEGRSTLFLLNYLKPARMVCVDTWQGADEHQGTNYIQDIEARFDHNIADYRAIIDKRRQTSFSYFDEQYSKPETFDLIYLDGSHYVDDVIIDAFRAFQYLKPGGILIFDDYLWKYYRRVSDNPCGAINAFLYLKRSHYKLLHVGYQLHLRKTK